MSLPYCEKFGFDTNKVKERLQWVELGDADHENAKRLQDVIRPRLAHIISEFYDWLSTLEEARKLLGDFSNLERLKSTQTGYLLTLGMGFDQLDYFESRLRVGQAHVWVGLSLSLYQCAYRRLCQLILEQIDHTAADAPALIRFAHKVTTLDMSLAIETYHLSQVQTLEEYLERSNVQQSQLLVASQTDSLTGLVNHQTIMDLMGKALNNPETKKPIAAVMADLDHFKQINDSHGHIVGDKVLVEVSRRMKAALRDFDYVGRYGGEEFLMVLQGADLETSRKVAERVRQHVCASPIHLHREEVEITISLGVTLAKPGDKPESLVERADKALYAAKHAGRNCVQFIQ